ncbi:MAG: hypothetical protein C4519_19810 [Desulfobacteraceae bacterium]|nr:MAG: hypothetical protein C4519_19810 [Desulfobacteraceae bacterium]
MIQIADRSRTDNEQIRIIDSRHLESKTDRSRTDNGQITDRSWSTTSNPNPDPDPDPDPDPKNTPLTPHGGAPSQALKEGQHEGTDAGSAAPIPFAEIIAYLNDKTGKQFKASTRETQRHIRARWGEGFRLHDFKRVVDNKASAWSSDPKMADYLRPQTLFGTKFEAYLNEGKTKRREVPIGGQFQKHDE